MKKINSNLHLLTTIAFFSLAVFVKAQTQTVTLAVGPNNPYAAYTCSSNQIVTIVALDFTTNLYSSSYPLVIGLSFTNGVTFSSQPIGNGSSLLKLGAIYTGLTQISVTAPYSISGQNAYYFPAILTVTVTTPCSLPQSTIPANAVVIPTDAKGPVQIVLESSGDLVNWTSSLPGTYGNTYTNRFFRVRAVAQ